MIWVWAALAACAFLWPTRLASALDGVPLDTFGEVLIGGIAFPFLTWCHPSFFKTRFARFCIVFLLVWKASTAAFLQRDGWCVQFILPSNVIGDSTNRPHSWDARADWRSAAPRCSAVLTRPLTHWTEFPAWFFNLADAEKDMASQIPPRASVTMRVSGFMTTSEPGILRIVTRPDTAPAVQFDGAASSSGSATLDAGIHRVDVETKLSELRWQFIPTWNGRPVWQASVATMGPPRTIDRWVRPWGQSVVLVVVFAFFAVWFVSALHMVNDVAVLVWAVAASVLVGSAAVWLRPSLWHFVIASLLIAVAVPVSERLRNSRGAVLLVGAPWLAFVAVMAAPLVGRFTLYTAGDDFWQFQRYAYRIYLQGYWLEGGEKTFWFQPLYRWIAGGLHIVFGDSSVGETLWDGWWLVASAMFSFHIARAFAGFRWGLAAAVTSLAVFTAGPSWVFIGRGLSEISSAGFLYCAALLMMRARAGTWRLGAAAGVMATLAFFTRLNNLPAALAIVLFAIALDEPAWHLLRVRTWISRVSWRPALAMTGTMAVGLAAFALRTWYYTGRFSVFYGSGLYGSGRYSQALWQPGVPISTALGRMAENVAVVLTMTDPPGMHRSALPMLMAALIAMLAVAGAPRLSRIPLNAVLFFFASISGSVIARSYAYPGRFSIHVIPIASAVFVCGLAVNHKVHEAHKDHKVADTSSW